MWTTQTMIQAGMITNGYDEQEEKGIMMKFSSAYFPMYRIG